MLKELGITSVTHDLPFRLNHVNCFMAEGTDGWKVIDTGLHRQDTVDLWERMLSGKSVTDIIITHYHPDHFGYAGGLQQKTGARVSMTQTDADEAKQVWKKDFIEPFHTYYKWAGLPEKLTDQIINNTKAFVDAVTPYPQIDHYLKEGERIQFGKYDYEVIFTPGHSNGLVCFYNKDKGVLLSTDHILPKITPNISYWFVGDLNPLGTYLQSLEKVKKLQADVVIPSHGEPFYHANERINEIIAHHDERLNETLHILNGKKTAYEVCRELFQRELTVHEMRFAMGETIAHLEYLKINGDCKRTTVDNTWLYYKS